MSCQDFPCCGHEAGCCPNYDESGRQTNMICVCGAELPVDNPVSICDSCLGRHDDFEDEDCYDEDGEFDCVDEWERRQDMMLEEQERWDFCETDEAYGCYGYDEY